MHDCLWQSIQGRDFVTRIHVESELGGDKYGRGNAWSEDVTPRLLFQLFRSHCFVFRRHVEHREAASLSRYGAFNTREACPFIIKVSDVPSGLDRNRWFKFLKRSSIPVVSFLLNVIQQPVFNYSWAYKRRNFSFFSTSIPFFSHSFSTSLASKALILFPKLFSPTQQNFDREEAVSLYS